MIRLTEEDLNVIHQCVQIAKETGEEPETVTAAHELLLKIERELMERGLADIQITTE